MPYILIIFHSYALNVTQSRDRLGGGLGCNRELLWVLVVIIVYECLYVMEVDSLYFSSDNCV